MKARKRKNIILWSAIVLPYLLLIPAAVWYFHKIKQVENASFIIINKSNLTLSKFNYQGELLQQSKVAVGINYGNKKKVGDMETPEGVFQVTSIEDASDWEHDFKGDDIGPIKGAYGPYFIRLAVPGQKGIGIHGTHDSCSIGTRASEGCIRMHNAEIDILARSVEPGTVVVITPGVNDVLLDRAIDSIKKTSRGYVKDKKSIEKILRLTKKP